MSQTAFRRQSIESTSGRKGQLRKTLNIFVWIIIGLLFVATAIWTIWAGRQPHTHSVWTPDIQSPQP